MVPTVKVHRHGPVSKEPVVLNSDVKMKMFPDFFRKKDVQSSLALVDLFGCVWVAGWKQVEAVNILIFCIFLSLSQCCKILESFSRILVSFDDGMLFLENFILLPKLQCCGSGSGSVCFWSSKIRIR
jgi:hypothetical protein